MKQWKKSGGRWSALLMAALLAASALMGCSGGGESSVSGSSASNTESQAVSESEPESSEPVEVRIAALKGPTAMGMVKFMDDVDQQAVTDENYTFQIVASPDEVTPQIAQGNVDIAAVPANLASILYNNMDGAVQVLTVNTLGVLYLVENGDTVQSPADLKGKTIYASGKGSTPEYALNYVLEHGIKGLSEEQLYEMLEFSNGASSLITTKKGALRVMPKKEEVLSFIAGK